MVLLSYEFFTAKIDKNGNKLQNMLKKYGISVGKRGIANKWVDGKLAVGKYISSFIGFFPANNPKYLALVIVDEPQGEYYGSTVAAPYAKQVFEGIINLKNIKPNLE